MKRTLMFLGPLLLAGGLRAAIATQSLNYQGQLTDLTDVPQTGNHQMAFELYNTATGGSALWSQVESAVPVTRGLFNVDLDLTSLPHTVANLNGSLYLQVTVDGQVLSPRKPVLAGLFALNADRLQGLEPGNAPNKIPVLDALGRLDPSVVSAPFPLAVSGAGGVATQAVSVLNSDLSAGQVGVRITAASAALSASAGIATGAGVLGYTAPSDSASASGVWGRAVSGVGVRAWSNSAGNTALQASNTAGLGIYGIGVYGGQLAATTLGLRIGGAALGGQSASTPVTGMEVNSTLQGIVINNAGANGGLSAIASGTGNAVEGMALSANGVGVRGEHSGSGFGTGIWGLSSAPGGTGIRAENINATGSGAAFKAQVASPAGVAVDAQGPNLAVRALANALTGVTYGLRAQADSADGQAVHGDAGGLNAAFGVYGSAPSSAGGAGVYGVSVNHGVWGQSTGGGNSYGVYGVAGTVAVRGDSTAGAGAAPRGVYGSTQSNDGTGVYGEALSSVAGNAFGVQGVALTAGGTGVSGQGKFRGIYGSTSSGNGHGVEGDAGPAGAGDNRAGVYASAQAGPNELVFGVYASVSGASASAYALRAQVDVQEAKAAQVVNTVAKHSSSGYALDVEGKFRIGKDNAGTYLGGAADVQWLVSCLYCGINDLILVTPQVDITNGGTVANSVWVGPGDVGDGYFIVHTSAPVANMRFQYLIIDK
jgi:hypothetical protein